VGLLQRLLIHQDTLSRGEHIAIFEPQAPFDKVEREKMWVYIQRVYDMFKQRVADSRRLELEQVEAIAGGRVYTGSQALANGLIDGAGGLTQAFEKARELSDLGVRAPVRFFTPGKGYLPPVTEAGALWRYAWLNLSALRGQAMCILPWVET
jgi:protease-4